MTPYPSADFALTVQAADARTLRLAIHGYLDYDTSDEFTPTVDRLLDAHAGQHGPALRHLHLDWTDLTAFDSSGLSALLGLRRRTHPAGITLHLHHQPDYFTRLLEVTGVSDHLTQHATAS
ncbi:anti-anti-sigma factor [Streptomyces sp. 3330]|uniref:STAS domain-containing protein n=1 Tax=Streptomyces sp. 3330 TaxID=2817755 RepID=UPI002862D651|nr:STAS domain-containing protein [Streptomyces sp. 3330]MDR6974230.1 anti-anti-sigma factor [Streptomyces sp. 3330]